MKLKDAYSLEESYDQLRQYSCLENPIDGGAWWAAVHGVAKSWTWLSDFTFTFYFHALEKDMATHSSVLAWRIPGTGQPHGLPSMGSHRVGHDWSDLVVVVVDSILKSRDSTWPTKVRLVKAMVFPVVMWKLDHKESWVLKNWYFWTVVLEKTLKSPLNCKEIQSVHPKGNQSWIFIGRTDVKAETPILWPPKELTHLKILWCWERLIVGGEVDDRGWDGWMASPTRWTWVWVNSRSWW